MSRKNCIIGIDPGLSGGIAVYDPAAKKLVTVFAMPVEKEQKGRSVEKNVDINALALAISDAVTEYGVDHIIVEKVAASSQMGVSSAFKFGNGFGIVQAVAELYVPNVHYVSPQKWKARMMLPKDKKASIELARKMFGKSPWFMYDSKDGLAEAALIAFYGARDLVVIEEENEPCPKCGDVNWDGDFCDDCGYPHFNEEEEDPLS